MGQWWALLAIAILGSLGNAVIWLPRLRRYLSELVNDTPMKFLTNKTLRRLTFRNDTAANQAFSDIRQMACDQHLPQIPARVLVTRRWIQVIDGQACCLTPVGLIILYSRTRNGKCLTRNDMLCLLGHEYGHLIDFGPGRKNHPFLVRIRKLPVEDFADAVAVYLCGKDAWQDTVARCRLRRGAMMSGRLELIRPRKAGAKTV